MTSAPGATRRRQFRLLVTAETLSLFGDQLLGVALPLAVFDHLGGASASVSIILARVVPTTLLGLAAGTIADRVNRRRLFIGVGLLRAALVLPLLQAESAGLGLVVAVVVGLAASGQVAAPAVGASVSAVVSAEDLPAANARLAARSVLVGLLAPTVGAALYAHDGLAAVVAVDVVLYLLTALVARALSFGPPASRGERGPVLADMVDGVRVLIADPLLRRLLAVVAVALVGLGVELAVLVPFVRGTLHGSAPAVGALAASQSLGGLVGALLVPVVARRRDARTLIGLGVLGLPAASVGFLLSRQVWQAVPGLLLAGLLMTLLSAGAQTHLQTAVPRTHVGRVLGVIGSVFGLASVVGTGAAAVLSRSVSLRGCLVVAAAVELLAVLVFASGAVTRRTAGSPARVGT